MQTESVVDLVHKLQRYSTDASLEAFYSDGPNLFRLGLRVTSQTTGTGV
jgi:hypothetical protein